jgi:single-stranded-DNA-specific exonuclease
MVAPAQVTMQGRKALWRVEERIPAEIREALQGESVMLSHLLYCRGYRTLDDIRAFFAGHTVEHDPFSLPDMEAAAERIERAIRARERIAIYGDFDADGITATAVLVFSLRALGVEPVAYIPTREYGHGLHPEALASLADERVSLVITADCGVTAVEEVQVARGMGMDVIVTDHHEARADGSLPDCLVVAPTRHDSLYPCRFLCGVGLAYKLAKALHSRMPRAGDPDDLLDLVALGTVADIVPLRDENRTLVIRGLRRLMETSRPGLLALFKAAGVDAGKIDPVAIGYYLAPRINAANRMATPRLAYDLITATDEMVAADLARQLSHHNERRQVLVEQHLEEIASRIGPPAEVAAEVAAGRRPPVLVVTGDWPAGISGLLASKLVDAYGLPAFVAADGGGEVVSVSARSVPGVRIDELLESAEASLPGGLFLGYGGHAGAGGFSVARERLEEAIGILADGAAGTVAVDEIGAVMTVDAEVSLAALSLAAAQGVRSLAPFGIGFPEPLFLTRNVTVKTVRPMNGGRHVRLRLAQGRDTYRDAVWFSAPPEAASLRPGTSIDIVYHLCIDEWNGLQKQELRIRDWRPAG